MAHNAGANPNSPTREYIYSGAGVLATMEGGTTKYHMSDHLSVRVTTDSSGNVLAQQAHYPFGETWYLGSGGTKWQFTSYERDTESGNDYAMMRYHVNRLGRYSSPDGLTGSIRDPESLNRYAYVGNEPINRRDPLGLFIAPNPDDGGSLDPTTFPYFPDLIVDPVPPGGTRDLCKALGICGPPKPPPPPGYEQCIMEALLEVIAHGEGMDTQPNSGYGTLVFGTVVSAPGSFSGLVGERGTSTAPITIENPEALSGHPGILVQVNSSVRSTAFGRYQILLRTATVTLGGWTDWSPAGQDAAATTLMWNRNMVEPALAGNIQQGILNGNQEWSSLPGSPNRQRTMTMAQALAAFQNALQTLPDCQ